MFFIFCSCVYSFFCILFFFVKQKTAYEVRISDWSSDVCSSDLLVEQWFDVAIRFGEIPDSRLTARTIAFNRRLLCAAPQYLQEFGAPMRPSDLRRSDERRVGKE